MSKHELQIVVENLHERYHSLNDGEVATYTPELGKADPDDFGICIVTVRLPSPHSSMLPPATRLLITFSVVSLVTCRDLAMMAATLANMGRNPRTGLPVFDIGAVRSMLSIMFTCGMYDYSGEWAYHVGVPAKSGCSNVGSSFLQLVL